MRSFSIQRHFSSALVAASAVCLAGWMSVSADDPPAKNDAPPLPVRLDVKHLPNAVQVAPKVISGGLPEGDAGFAELEKLGVKTVISVDGMKPDVVGAKKHGLRYVHLPHGYDGVPEARVQALAKAVRDLPGPIYIHCHHGKHRSPAAAAVACVTAGLVDAKSGRGILEFAGTGKNYVGLYRDVENARKVNPATLDALEADFPEVAKLPPMAEAMVEIEHSFDRMKQVAAAEWRTPPDHPDVDPAHEALILREQFTELLRTDDVNSRPEDFRQMLRNSERLGEMLEESLQAPRTKSTLSHAQAALNGIAANCAACHKAYRDAPLDKKSTD